MQNDKLSKLIKRVKRRNLAINLIFIDAILLINVIGITTAETYIGPDIWESILIFLTCLVCLICVILAFQECIDYLRDGSSIDSVKDKLNKEELQYLEKNTKPHKWEIQYWLQKICSIVFKNKKDNKSTKETKQNMGKTLWIIGFIVLLGIIGVIMDDTDYSTTQITPQVQTTQTETPKTEVKQNQPKEDLTWFAEYACQQEIKARAIYPPSVKVHFRRDNYIKGNSYTIYGTVDSQNAFGAMVRQNFACEAIIDKENDKYWVNDLNIE